MNGLDLDIVVQRERTGGDPFRLEVAFQAGRGITVVCGASGSGKSTLLLAMLGWLTPQGGSIRLDGETLFDARSGRNLPIRERGIGMVLQEAPLFPHLDVAGNVAFGIRGSAGGDQIRDLLERVGAADLAGNDTSELSGGQRQRVALARALAAGPRALLLDEPFSALDPTARESLGELIVELQHEAGIPFVHVTHDLSEALRLGQQMVLLDRGSVVQAGAPAEVLARPATPAAARAVGTENRLQGTILAHDPSAGCSVVDLAGTCVQTLALDLPVGHPVELGLRAEEILLSLDALERTSARNVLAGRVQHVGPRAGAVEIQVATPVLFRVLVTPISVRELGLHPGQPVHLLIKASAFHRLL